MKIRNGFVTNSSSSSFIIAISGGLENLENIVEVENKQWKKFIINGIKELMEREDGNDTHEAEVMFANMKDLNAWLDREGEWVDVKEKKEFSQLISNGYVVYRKSVGYCDTGTSDQLKTIGDECDFIKIIKRED